MTFNYIKKTLCTIVTITCTFFLSLSFIHPKAAGEIQFLTACVGETYDTVGINYHCTEDNSYLIYGTALSGENIANPIQVEVTSTLWSYQSDFAGSGTPDYEKGYKFEERYVCKAQLTNLLANTTYYYQAISNSSKSDIQSFTTTTTDASRKSFLFLTDIQSSGTSFSNAETLIQAIETTSNCTPNLIVMTGDQVDRGGIEQQWIDYYKYIPSLHNKLQATIPGNHEYYLTSGSGYISNEIYNQFSNNPMNGPTDRLGSSYYFIWDQILFIMLDTVKQGYDVQAQQEWFRNVVKNNPSQWIIVGSHPGVYATGAYASDADIMRRNWLKVFEECQVDLAINGHEHVYCRKNNRYGGSSTSTDAGPVDDELGITYLQGAAAGLKSYSDLMKPELLDDYDKILKGNNNMGVLVNVETGRLIIKCYMASGLVVDQFELTAKRPTEIATVTKETVEESITATFDRETNSVNVSWTPDLYGNATSVDVNAYLMDVNHTKMMNQNIVIASTATKANSRTYKGYYETSNYIFNVKVNMTDGTIIEKEIPLILNESILEYQINYELNGGTNSSNNPSKYILGNLPLSLEDPTKLGYNFKGWINKETGRKVREIKEGTTGDLTLVAEYEIAKYTISYILDGATLPDDTVTSYTIESIPNLPTPMKEGYLFTNWTLNGEPISSLSPTTTGNLVLTANFEKINYTIHYELDGGTIGADAPLTYTIDGLQTLPKPEKTGYKFTGWLLNNQKVSSIAYGTTKDITLVATFEKETYKITYVLDGATLPTNAPTDYTIDAIPTLVTPTKSGYEFTGWQLNGKTIDTIPTDTIGDITLTATFQVIELTPEPGIKKGCKKTSIATLIASITLLAGTCLIIRKKH